MPKWVPVGGEDRFNNLQSGYRLLYFLDKHPPSPDDVALGVSAPAPFISDTGAWSNFFHELLGYGPKDFGDFERIIFSFQDGIEGTSMAIKRKVSVFIAFPSLVMKIAEGLKENAPILAKARLKENFKFVNLLAYLITRVVKIQARNLVKVHTGVFAGEPLEPYRKALLEAWNLQHTYNMYTSTEFQISFGECSEQNGMHVWLDACLPEIIPQEELSKERDQEGYTPDAIPLWESQPGDEGELVLTNFAKTFPLIRWRTSDLIKVIDIGECPCGRTHPRINILQRSDDLVNLGVIRFSTFTIKEALEHISKPTTISTWQIRVGRKTYKPLLTVIVRPETIVDEVEIKESVQGALDKIETLRVGWENDLISKPMIFIDYNLGDRLSSSGKHRPLVYEEN
ncbi:phenylacetate--CoA ligase family protein [Candidatus Thorarchaeota archaeon]|nr:MAG: phenylacetate--CoA ligase family protein [Candidatus Thorarchaeota archaeon]